MTSPLERCSHNRTKAHCELEDLTAVTVAQAAAVAAPVRLQTFYKVDYFKLPDDYVSRYYKLYTDQWTEPAP